MDQKSCTHLQLCHFNVWAIYKTPPFPSKSPERLDGAVPVRRQVEHLRQGLRAPLDLRPGHPVQPPEVGQRLRDGELGEQRQLLEIGAKSYSVKFRKSFVCYMINKEEERYKLTIGRGQGLGKSFR